MRQKKKVPKFVRVLRSKFHFIKGDHPVSLVVFLLELHLFLFLSHFLVTFNSKQLKTCISKLGCKYFNSILFQILNSLPCSSYILCFIYLYYLFNLLKFLIYFNRKFTWLTFVFDKFKLQNLRNTKQHLYSLLDNMNEM